VSPSTYNNRLSILSSFYTHAMRKCQLLQYNPIERLEPRKGCIIYKEREETFLMSHIQRSVTPTPIILFAFGVCRLLEIEAMSLQTYHVS